MIGAAAVCALGVYKLSKGEAAGATVLGGLLLCLLVLLFYYLRCWKLSVAFGGTKSRSRTKLVRVEERVELQHPAAAVWALIRPAEPLSNSVTRSVPSRSRVPPTGSVSSSVSSMPRGGHRLSKYWGGRRPIGDHPFSSFGSEVHHEISGHRRARHIHTHLQLRGGDSGFCRTSVPDRSGPLYAHVPAKDCRSAGRTEV